MARMPVFDLDLDGHPARHTVTVAELDAVHLPLLHHWEKWKGGGRSGKGAEVERGRESFS